MLWFRVASKDCRTPFPEAAEILASARLGARTGRQRLERRALAAGQGQKPSGLKDLVNYDSLRGSGYGKVDEATRTWNWRACEGRRAPVSGEGRRTEPRKKSRRERNDCRPAVGAIELLGAVWKQGSKEAAKPSHHAPSGAGCSLTSSVRACQWGFCLFDSKEEPPTKYFRRPPNIAACTELRYCLRTERKRGTTFLLSLPL